MSASAIAASALALGGAVRWGALVGAGLAVAAAIPYVTSRRTASHVSPLVLLVGVALALTALQLVPLPSPLVHLLAGEKLALVTDHARAWGEDAPAFVAASYDPPATLVELAKLCGNVAVAFVATRLASDRRGRQRLAMVAASAGVLVALVALVHEALGMTTIYGVFVSPVRTQLVSPLINENHLASLMAIAAPVSLGLAIAARGIPRGVWIGAALLTAAVALLSGSRGGALGLGLGLVVTAVTLLLQHRRTDDRGRRATRAWIPLAVTAACVVTLLVALTASHLANELAATRLDEVYKTGSKYQIWGHALAMLGEHPWLGTGHGAFAQAFSRWSPVGQHAYSHAENSYVQTIVDWGVPGAVAIALATFAVLRAARRRWRESPIEAGAIGALSALAVHELADFSLELPVIALVAIVLLAILAPARLGTDKAEPARTLRARALRVGAIAAGAVICILAATSLGRPAVADAEAIAGTPTEQLAAARAATARHPADYLLMGRAAQALRDLGDARAVPVITRAIYLHPRHAGLHRIAATLLARSQHPSQAQAEFALALQYTAGDIRPTLAEVLSTFPVASDAARALPLDATVAPRIVNVLQQKYPEVVLAYSQRLALLQPDERSFQILAAEAALTSKQGDLALLAARAADALKRDAESVSLVSRSLALTGDADGAMTMIRAALAGIHDEGRVPLLLTLADLELEAGAVPSASATLDEVEKLATDRKWRISLHLRRATLHERKGETNQARWQRDLARKLQSGGS